MELWIPITIAAAFMQNLRSAAQKHLKSMMGTTGATFARFGLGLPFVGLMLLALLFVFDNPLPRPSPEFFAWIVGGGITQIAATFLLIQLFSYRNFAVGTAYSRTEPIQAALFGLILLQETASTGALFAVLTSVAGVMLISVAHTTLSAGSLVGSLLSRNALMGLGSGMLFGISAVSYRAASLSLGETGFLMPATFTLFCTILFQTLIMLIWMIWKEPAELGRVIKAWKPALFVGFTGASASLGWFTALTLQQAAIVKTLAQIELIFTFMASVWFFHEQINRREIAGCLLISAGIIMLLVIG